jgi:hypothetical protein
MFKGSIRCYYIRQCEVWDYKCSERLFGVYHQASHSPVEDVAFAGEHGDDAISYSRCAVSNTTCFASIAADKSAHCAITGYTTVARSDD